MWRKINDSFVNLDLIETITPNAGDGKEITYGIRMISGRTFTVPKREGDAIILAARANGRKAVKEQVGPKKSAKDLQQVLDMAKRVNSPFGR